MIKNMKVLDDAAQYHANPLQFSTDGSEKDLEELVSIYTEAWEQINPGNGGIIRIG